MTGQAVPKRVQPILHAPRRHDLTATTPMATGLSGVLPLHNKEPNMLELMDYPNALRFIEDRLESDEWWTLVVASKEGAELALQVVQHFYRGENGGLFNLLYVPTAQTGVPFLFLAFAAKCCMSAEQLGDLIGTPVPDDKSIFIPHTTPPVVVFWLENQLRRDEEQKSP